MIAYMNNVMKYNIRTLNTPGIELKNKFNIFLILFILLNNFNTLPTLSILNIAVSNSSFKNEIYLFNVIVVINSQTTIKSTIFHPS